MGVRVTPADVEEGQRARKALRQTRPGGDLAALTARVEALERREEPTRPRVDVVPDPSGGQYHAVRVTLVGGDVVWADGYAGLTCTADDAEGWPARDDAEAEAVAWRRRLGVSS